MCEETLKKLRQTNMHIDETEAHPQTEEEVCGSFQAAILFLLDASLKGDLVPDRLKEATVEYRRFLVGQ